MRGEAEPRRTPKPLRIAPGRGGALRHPASFEAPLRFAPQDEVENGIDLIMGRESGVESGE